MFVPLKGGKETLLGYVVINYLFYNRVMFLYVSTSFKRFGEVCEFNLRGLKCINILSKTLHQLHLSANVYPCMCFTNGRGRAPEDIGGLGEDKPGEINRDDDEFDLYRKRMMLAYRFRPNPLVRILLLFKSFNHLLCAWYLSY